MDVISGDFEWDSKKSESNWKKHGVAFEDSKEIFDASHLRFRSDRSDEARWLTIEPLAKFIKRAIFRSAARVAVAAAQAGAGLRALTRNI
jgi:uncharacterized DUF497 family protein